MVNSTKGNTPIAHRNFLSIQPLVTAMRHNTLNTLDEVAILRANSSVITRLHIPHGQRQSIDGETEIDNVDKPVASRNKPTVRKVFQGL